MRTAVVAGSFDDIRSPHVRFLEEASREGRAYVLLYSDRTAAALEGRAPQFPFTERLFLVSALRWVSGVIPVDAGRLSELLPLVRKLRPDLWVSQEDEGSNDVEALCRSAGLQRRRVKRAELSGFPDPTAGADLPGGPARVVVTGCFDWLHSGHVRFFEDVSGLGELHVVLGSDANVGRLKGPGHPMFGEDERRYMVGSVRFVRRAWISSGQGWLDAEPEIAGINPAIYAVNEDGDRPEKREYCRKHGIKYIVLKRKPRNGLPPRESSALRGF